MATDLLHPQPLVLKPHLKGLNMSDFPVKEMSHAAMK
jgi:hypothetical protein